jgi:CheY-like chemotaxis protein
LILIDVCMPDLDGFELAALIREHPCFRRIAIIFVSAWMHSDLDRLRGYELGALDCIAVPVAPEHALGFGIELTCYFPSKLPPAFADSHQLELALLTVALDARDAMTAGGRVIIGASEERQATDVPDPRLPAGSYVRIQVDSVPIATGRTQPNWISTEIDADNYSAISVIRMMIDQAGGAVQIERRANAATTVALG